MKIHKYLLGAALLAAAGTANAGLYGEVGITSDYDFRGISQSAGDPAFFGELGWEFDFGLYAGVWASSIDFGDCCDEDYEADLYIGFANEIGDSGVEYDIGYVEYTYPGTSPDIDYGEFYGGISIENFSTYLWYSDDVYGLDLGNGWYIEGNLDFDFFWDTTLTAHMGYVWGDAFDGANAIEAGNPTYFDYGLYLTKEIGGLVLKAFWVDTDMSSPWKVGSGPFQNDSRFGAQVSFVFGTD